jgi:hypothetical protein
MVMMMWLSGIHWRLARSRQFPKALLLLWWY